ncbi:MAG: addiction module toxin RelE [Bacteroidales bacterium]|nr:addiction module toxin RelE [Bacteroidales bacterium]
MNLQINVTTEFAKAVKRLHKRYRSLADDLRLFQESLKENPFQGVELTPGIRKVRMAIKSKGKGKSGGARVITYNVLTSECDGVITLLLIYDKEDDSTVKLEVVKELVESLGL